MLPERIEEAVRTVICWVRRYTDDWSVVKHEILGELDNEHRKYFSKRDKLTKELPEFNSLELEIITLWKKITGVSLKRRPLAERRNISWWNPDKIVKHKGKRPNKRKNVGW
jgi:hypothetical protein